MCFFVEEIWESFGATNLHFTLPRVKARKTRGGAQMVWNVDFGALEPWSNNLERGWNVLLEK